MHIHSGPEGGVGSAVGREKEVEKQMGSAYTRNQKTLRHMLGWFRKERKWRLQGIRT